MDLGGSVYWGLSLILGDLESEICGLCQTLSLVCDRAQATPEGKVSFGGCGILQG
jgi:hypothetical protein